MPGDGKEVDEYGRPVSYGWDEERGEYYPKTTRGCRGPRKPKPLRDSHQQRESSSSRRPAQSRKHTPSPEPIKRRRDNSSPAASSGAQPTPKRSTSRPIAARTEERQRQDSTEDKGYAASPSVLSQNPVASPSEKLLAEEEVTQAEFDLKIANLRKAESDRRQQVANKVRRLQELEAAEAEAQLDRERQEKHWAQRKDSLEARNQKLREDKEREDEVAANKRQQKRLEQVCVALDFNGCVKPDDKKHIPVAHINAIQRLQEDANVDPFILSFVIDRKEETCREVSESGLEAITGQAVCVNQKIGSPYWRNFTDSSDSGAGYTSGGKDYYLSTKGFKVLIEDRADIAKACERQGVIVYRVRSERDRHHNHPLAFDTFTEALQALTRDILNSRQRYMQTTSYWNQRIADEGWAEKKANERGYHPRHRR